MIYEYAVSPALFDSDAHLAFLYEAFGIEAGRLISEYPPRKWDRIARAVINETANGEYQRRAWTEVLIALLKRARYERPGSQWNDGINWVTNAIAEHVRPGRPGFHGLLVESGLLPHPDAVAIGTGTAAHRCWPCPGSQYVDRVALAMVTVVAPLLNLSTQVILIDRYFHPVDGSFVNFLSTIAMHLRTNGAIRPVSQIKYVTSNIKMTMELMEAQCRALLPSAVPRGMDIKFFILPKELLHDRFILTNLGAAQYGQGLDEAAGLHEGNGQVLVTRLGNGTFGTLTAKWETWADKDSAIGKRVFSVSGTA